MRWMPLVFFATSLPVLACSPPKLSTPLADIPKLATLDEVMDNQATVADPQWKKIGQSSYTEAGRAEVGKGGIVRDEAVQRRVIEEVAAAADALGLRRAAVTESPIAGMEGNREFFMHLR